MAGRLIRVGDLVIDSALIEDFGVSLNWDGSPTGGTITLKREIKVEAEDCWELADFQGVWEEGALERRVREENLKDLAEFDGPMDRAVDEALGAEVT